MLKTKKTVAFKTKKNCYLSYNSNKLPGVSKLDSCYTLHTYVNIVIDLLIN